MSNPTETASAAHSSLPSARYRPDIDGLRALAVLAVILYHAGVRGFAGGFVGVDVFFVISGYLITSLLLAERAADISRGLREFYLRRARRILPALLVVVAATTVVAWYLLLPLDLWQFGMALTSSVVFLGNWAAWKAGGYFTQAIAHAPLVHLWSIAVEEQFYLVFPLLLAVSRRYGSRAARPMLGLLALVSLALYFWAQKALPVASYYLGPTRAWELLLGALVALSRGYWPGDRRWNELASIVALGAIVFACSSLAAAIPYPSLIVLGSCAGTACLIAAGGSGASRVSRLLSKPSLVAIGLMSYSIYLWHWPILCFLGYYHIVAPNQLVRLAWVACVFPVAWFSWFFVERPVRQRRVLARQRTFVWTALGVSASLCALGLVIWRFQGLPGRFPPQLQAMADSIGKIHPDIGRCFTLSLAQIEAGQLCQYGPDRAGSPRAFVWGDSHAMALLPDFERLAEEKGVETYVLAASECGPLLDVRARHRFDRARISCSTFNQAAVAAIDKLKPDLVILGGYWTYIEGLLVASGDSAPPPDGMALFEHGLRRTLQRIGAPGRNICVVLDVPELKLQVPYAMAMSRRRGINDEFIAARRAEVLAQYEPIESTLRRLQSAGLMRTVDTKDALCRLEHCEYQSNGAPLYRDNNHLSVAGAQYVERTLEPCFSGLAQDHEEMVAHRAQSGPAGAAALERP